MSLGIMYFLIYAICTRKYCGGENKSIPKIVMNAHFRAPTPSNIKKCFLESFLPVCLSVCICAPLASERLDEFYSYSIFKTSFTIDQCFCKHAMSRSEIRDFFIELQRQGCNFFEIDWDWSEVVTMLNMKCSIFTEFK